LHAARTGGAVVRHRKEEVIKVLCKLGAIERGRGGGKGGRGGRGKMRKREEE